MLNLKCIDEDNFIEAPHNWELKLCDSFLITFNLSVISHETLMNGMGTLDEIVLNIHEKNVNNTKNTNNS